MSETVTIPANLWKDALVKIDKQLKTNGELAAENERLRKASFVTAVPSEEYERLKKALKDIEKAWYDQRPGDVIKIVDEALAWRETE